MTKLKDSPTITANDKGMVTSLNQDFTKAYGWTEVDLVGQPLSKIVPSNMRSTHQIGFSRFITTEKPRILGKSLKLPITLKDGTTQTAEHTITAQKNDSGWEFKAIIKQDKSAKKK